MERKILNTKTLIKGTTKKIEVNKYWDSHGTEVDWGQDTVNYDSEKTFEIISHDVEFSSEYIDPVIFEEWEILVDGKRFDHEFELTGYKLLKTKLVLHACVGAG